MNEAETLKEIKKRNSDFELRIAFDVGAHVGNVSQTFIEFSNHVVVHAFEPVPATFEKLRERFESHDSLVLNRMALSSSGGTKDFTIGRNTGNRFASLSDKTLRTEPVQVITGDQYCAENHIDEIDFLKVDAEGHDLEALIGFRNQLAAKKVQFIQVECSPDSRNKYHVPLVKIANFLDLFGYCLFGMGEVVFFDNEVRLPTRSIWYCNAIFVRT